MKFYLADAQAPASFADTGYHPAAQYWLRANGRKSVVALPNEQARPSGYQLLGQGADLATVPGSDSIREQLRNYLGLTQAPRPGNIGRQLFDAMTLGANHATTAPNPIEPHQSGKLSLWLNGQPLHQVDFDRAADYAQPIIARKASGYERLRGRGVTVALKYLRRQEQIGFSRADVQGKYSGDGPSLTPSTQVTESGTPDQAWTITGGGGTLDWTGAQMGLSVGTSGNRVVGCHAGVSLGDHRVTVDVASSPSSAVNGPACRLEDPDGLLAAEKCYCLYFWSGSWYLRWHQMNTPGTWGTVANASYGAQNYIATHWVEASGSDITAQFDALAIGPYTDTTCPDTQLFGGVTLYNTASKLDNWILDDFVSPTTTTTTTTTPSPATPGKSRTNMGISAGL